MSIDLHLQFLRGEFLLDAKLSLPSHGVSVIFGRSGSGKTLLLRALAGLEKAQGSVCFNGEYWQDNEHFLPTHQRPVGFVFQEASLLAHLDVRSNLDFGYRRVPANQRRIQFDDAVQLLGIGDLLTHKSQALSGGQRQRVAIAQALLTSPQLLLMDEPLASLDADSKTEILPYLEKLRDELDMPMLYVTHAADEMARLADTLVLIDNGRVQACGLLNELLTDPTLPVAHLYEAAAVVDATVLSHDEHYQLTTVNTPGGSLIVPRSPLPAGSEIRVRILARDVSIALAPIQHSSILNSLVSRIIDISADNDAARVLVRLDLNGTHILSRITRRSADTLGLSAGMQVYVQIKAVALM